ncbi:hypothetical protein CHS0354_007128, partial [Potamilus streckersoni]
MEFEQSLVLFHRLYHNDQLIALVWDSSCDVSTKSPFYCRLRCSVDGDTNKTRNEINNVTENESGLYKLYSDGKEIEQRFLNITGIAGNKIETMKECSLRLLRNTPIQFIKLTARHQKKLDDDNCQLEVTDNISNMCESSSLAGEKLLDVYHKGTGFIREGCTSFSVVCSSAESNAHRDSPVSEAAGKRRVARGKLDTYAKVKK